MKFLNDLRDRIQQTFGVYIDRIKLRVLGPNNENVDFILDSFYKLTPQQQNGAVAGGIALVAVFVLSAFLLFFSQVNALEEELNNSFIALHELKRLKIEDQVENKRFEQLVSKVKEKTRNLVVKPFFENLSRTHQVEMKGLSERTIDMDSTNPLSSKIKEVQVEMRLPKISIPRLMKSLIDIEKSGHYLRLQDLKITGLYGNKLYFDASLLVRGYALAR